MASHSWPAARCWLTAPTAFTPTTFNAGNVAVTGGVLGGTGRISGSVLVKNGGTITAGASIGTLTLATNLTLETGAAGLFEVTNPPGQAISSWCRAISRSPAAVRLSSTLSGTPLGAGTYPLIQYSGKKSGSFNTVPVIAAGSINGSYSISDSTPGQINLVVVPDVTITGQPADIVVSTNDPATFSVIATGEAPIDYQWYFYGATGTYTPIPMTDATNASFTIPSAQFTDSGILRRDRNQRLQLGHQPSRPLDRRECPPDHLRADGQDGDRGQQSHLYDPGAYGQSAAQPSSGRPMGWTCPERPPLH